MHPSSTGIYIALLSGGIILLTLTLVFVITIIRYHSRKMAFERQKIREEFSCLDRERERIALDLHDDLGASVSSIKLRLQCIVSPDEATRKVLDQAGGSIDELMDKLRRVSFNLAPGVLRREGLDEALRELMDRVPGASGMGISYRYQCGRLADQQKIHLYRIAQEILNNIVKHSGATRASLAIAEGARMIEFNIADNGKGFDTGDSEVQRRGLGLHSISSRVELLGGQLYLDSSPKGTDYLIRIPKSP